MPESKNQKPQSHFPNGHGLGMFNPSAHPGFPSQFYGQSALFNPSTNFAPSSYGSFNPALGQNLNSQSIAVAAAPSGSAYSYPPQAPAAPYSPYGQPAKQFSSPSLPTLSTAPQLASPSTPTLTSNPSPSFLPGSLSHAPFTPQFSNPTVNVPDTSLVKSQPRVDSDEDSDVSDISNEELSEDEDFLQQQRQQQQRQRQQQQLHSPLQPSTQLNQPLLFQQPMSPLLSQSSLNPPNLGLQQPPATQMPSLLSSPLSPLRTFSPLAQPKSPFAQIKPSMLNFFPF